MRHLSDEELAKYFDEETPGASGGNGDGWTLDDAFANPKQTQTSIPAERAVSRPRSVIPDPETPAPLKRPRLSERPMHPVRPVSRQSQIPSSQLDAHLTPSDQDTPPPPIDLTWTGRDVQPKSAGSTSKTMMMFMIGLAACAVFVFMMSGGEPGSSLPQIGR